MLDVQVIASGSGGNAYALHPQDGGPSLLLEAGVRYADLQVALQHRVSKLAACLVSHEHGDHSRSARNVMQAGVNVYASHGTLAALHLEGHRAVALKSLERSALPGGWTVVPFPAVHDAAEPLGFLVGYAGETVLYVTDSAFCAYRFAGVTVAMVEANYHLERLMTAVAAGNVPDQHAARVIRNHLSIERAIDLLKANDLSKCREVILLHLSAGNSDAEEFKDLVQRATGIPTRVAEERGVYAGRN